MLGGTPPLAVVACSFYMLSLLVIWAVLDTWKITVDNIPKVYLCVTYSSGGGDKL